MRPTVLRSIGLVVLGLTLVSAPVGGSAGQPDQRSGIVAVTADVQPHSSLRVSTGEMRFVVPVGAPATVAAEELGFLASARTSTGGEVLMSVEAAGTLVGPDGLPAGPSPVITFNGIGDGTTNGKLDDDWRTAARWVGSGTRSGALVFTLHGTLQPGTYRIPIRLALSLQ